MSATVRFEIQQLVSALTPLDQVEKEHIDFVLRWIESGSELFRTQKPATPATHLVSYFVVVSPEREKILLVDHKKASLWLPPGGHVEPGEHPKETVRREVKEELGIEAEFLFDAPILLTVNQTFGNVAQHTDVSLWYVIQADPDHRFNYDQEEFHQIRWFDLSAIPLSRTDPHLPRFIQKMASYTE
ncbi:NUDIX hydrolase [Candidatus Protochlamydia phocaeensis]|uniref:NUDIX hydrolase n=1 Tax=Candidatus Protochlamydia phocaeensis TaxID=1414722 RepID=UPI00083922DF|nr:NUDIX domain-containing protein [Candidatus Protochlamydia phocaeensis]